MNNTPQPLAARPPGRVSRDLRGAGVSCSTPDGNVRTSPLAWAWGTRRWAGVLEASGGSP
eukprot:5781811-Pyramimonas_sp.AAC.1